MGSWIIILLNGKGKLVCALLIFFLGEYITDYFLRILNKHKKCKKENVLIKKASVVLLIVIANVVDILVLKNKLNIGILVIAFYIYDSGMAILNNVKRLGVPLPSILVKILKLLSGE